jgi:hypothetical protein
MSFRFFAGLVLSAAMFAQGVTTLSGTVADPSGAVVPGATVTLANALMRFSQSVTTNQDGQFQFSNISFNTYSLRVVKPGFDPADQNLSLRSSVPVTLKVTLSVTALRDTTKVVASDQLVLLDPEATGTRTELSQQGMEKMPTPIGGRGIESALLTFPGFAQNANGAIHPRGAHNQMTFVVDGMPITDQLTGAFATGLDANMVQNLELYTGNTPAEYGMRTAAVVNITTRTGMDTGRLFQGSTQASAAEFDTLANVTQFSGGTDKWGYFTSFTAMKSNRFLDSVSLDNLHNGGNAQRVFTRLDYRATPRDTFRLNLMSGRSGFQLANLRSQHAAGQNQRQLFNDWSGAAGWLRTLDARSTFDVNVSYRASVAWLFGSPGDTPVTADQARRLSTLNIATRYSTNRGRHNIRAGIDFQYFPVSENFFFAITGRDFNVPGTPDFNPFLFPHDLTRGGRRFVFSSRRSGQLPSAFVQDSIKMGRWVVSLGLRYDYYRFLVQEDQWQPRVGVAFNIRETGTVLRASYNRTYQTPPNENLLLSGSPRAAALVPPAVREALGTGQVQIRPERQNAYEVGLQQAISKTASLTLAYFHKNSQDQQDNDNFLNTGIIFPITLRSIRVNGAEARLNIPNWRRFSGTLSATHYRAISNPPFSGGLFLGSSAIDALTAGPFVIDHDQTLGLQGNLQYNWKKGWWASTAIRYDSGLVSNRSDPAEVAADPDYADLLPYVNLRGNPPRVNPRTVTDFALGYEHTRDGRKRWDASLQVSNAFDVTALYNFQSIFVGTRVVQPRTFGGRLRWFF